MTASAVAAAEINPLKCRKSAAVCLGLTDERRTFSGNTVILRFINISKIFPQASRKRARAMETPLKLQSVEKPIFGI